MPFFIRYNHITSLKNNFLLAQGESLPFWFGTTLRLELSAVRIGVSIKATVAIVLQNLSLFMQQPVTFMNPYANVISQKLFSIGRVKKKRPAFERLLLPLTKIGHSPSDSVCNFLKWIPLRSLKKRANKQKSLMCLPHSNDFQHALARAFVLADWKVLLLVWITYSRGFHSPMRTKYMNTSKSHHC